MKMKLRSRPVLVLFLACWAAAAAAQEAADYNPLAVGLRWTAAVTMTKPDGSTVQGTATREITGTEVIGGKTYFVSETSVSGIPGMGAFTTYRRKAADGIFSIDGSDASRTERLETALPLAVGKKWEAPSAAGGKVFFEVEAQEAATAGKRKFEKCFKITWRSEDGAMSGQFHLAPNAGNVLETTKSAGTTLQFVIDSLTQKKRG